MSEHAGKAHKRHKQRGRINLQSCPDGQRALEHVAQQGGHAPAEAAEPGDIGGPYAAAAVRARVHAAKSFGDDQSPGHGAQHVGRHYPERLHKHAFLLPVKATGSEPLPHSEQEAQTLCAGGLLFPTDGRKDRGVRFKRDGFAGRAQHAHRCSRETAAQEVQSGSAPVTASFAADGHRARRCTGKTDLAACSYGFAHFLVCVLLLEKIQLFADSVLPGTDPSPPGRLP